MLLDLLHGALRVQRVQDDLVLVERRRRRHRLAQVLGPARQAQRLGPVEGGRQAHLAHLAAMDLQTKKEERKRKGKGRI